MKKINKLVCLLFSIILLGGCDNFLDIQPTGKVIPRTGAEFRALLAQAYDAVPEGRGYTTFRSDEMKMNSAISTSEDLNSYLDVWLWNDLTPSGTTVTPAWRTFYEVLFIANYVIESKNSIKDAGQDEINQMVGEAYMLRAYMHFILVNLYGEPYTNCDPATSKAVPLKLNSSVEETLYRNTVGDIYDAIISDMDQAEVLINKETWDTGYTYRFNKLSVDALRSRVYLYMGDWSNSLHYSEAVLSRKNTLVEMSGNVLPNYYLSEEAIVSLEQILTSSYKNAGRVADALYRSYGTGDLRKSKFYKAVTASNVQVTKGGDNSFRCTFRVGEMYLNAAEASLMTGDSGMEKAKNLLLQLMKTRYNQSAYTNKETAVNAMNSAELLEEIYAERFRELAFEGHRWFDLRRTTRPRMEKVYKNETYTLNENDSRYTLLIPTEAIEANPNLAN